MTMTIIGEGVLQMSVAEYLAFEESSEIKHEFIDGEAYPMTGGTLNHAEIMMNVGGELRQLLRRSDCKVLSSAMRIGISPTRYVYPDVSVVCGEPVTEYESQTLLNPTLVVEVTSPSTISSDRVIKREYYESVDSMQAYLVIDQHRVMVEMYTRADGGWLLQRFSDLDAVIPLKPLGCDLPVADIYHGIRFEQEDSAAAAD